VGDKTQEIARSSRVLTRPAQRVKLAAMGTRALTVAACLAFQVGACHRASAVGPCAKASSFEEVFANKNPDFAYKAAAPDNASAWFAEDRPFFCTEHILDLWLEDTEFGPEIVITPTIEGRRLLLDTTKAHVGEYVLMRMEGRARIAAHLETPLDVSSLRITMGGALAKDAPGIVSRLRDELARRSAPRP
jgi:hypothetical protein